MGMFLARIKTKVGEYEFTEFIMFKDYDTQEEVEAAVSEEMKHYWRVSSVTAEASRELQSVTPVSTFEELVDQIPSY